MKQIYLDIINKIRLLCIFNTIMVYNNDVDRMRMGLISYELPAIFVEIEQLNAIQLGNNFVASDINIIFHILEMELDAENNTYDQNLSIFTYRDMIHLNFEHYSPTNCSPMLVSNEVFDYKHGDMYHYVYKLKTHYIDSSAYTPKELLQGYYIIWSNNNFVWSDLDLNWEDMFGSLDLNININNI